MSELFKFRRYRLEVEGVAQGAFAEMDPPGARVPVVFEDGRPRRADEPGTRTHATLFDGVANTRELEGWLSRVAAGGSEAKAVTLVELADDGRPVARHAFEGAFPVRLRLAALSERELFRVDELELAVERWSYAPAGDEEEAIPASPAARVR